MTQLFKFPVCFTFFGYWKQISSQLRYHPLDTVTSNSVVIYNLFQSQQLVPQQTMTYYNNTNTTINNTAVVASGVVAPQQLPQQQPPQLNAAALTPHQQVVPPPSVVPAPLVATAVVNGTALPEEVISASIPVAVMPSPVTAAPNLAQQVAMIPTQTPAQSLQPVPQAQIPLQQTAVPGIVPPPGHPNIIKPDDEEVEQDSVLEDDNEEEQEGADDHEVVGEEEEKAQQEIMEDAHHQIESGEIAFCKCRGAS